MEANAIDALDAARTEYRAVHEERTAAYAAMTKAEAAYDDARRRHSAALAAEEDARRALLRAAVA